MPTDQVPRGQGQRQKEKVLKPFRSKLFLYRMLGAIFFVEALFLGFAFFKCSQPAPGRQVVMVAERCPKLGERSETLFIAAISATLSLLAGQSLPEE